MRFVVIVYEESGAEGEPKTTNPSPVYRQTVDEADFNLPALIRAVNTKKRGPRGRAKKGEA